MAFLPFQQATKIQIWTLLFVRSPLLEEAKEEDCLTLPLSLEQWLYNQRGNRSSAVVYVLSVHHPSAQQKNFEF